MIARIAFFVVALALPVAVARSGDGAGPQSSDSLLGASATVSAPTPREFRGAEPAYATFRQGASFGYQFDVPDGEYRVEVGFLELVWRRPGQRIFEVRLNGAVVAAAIDPVAIAGRAPQRIERTFETRATGGGVRLMFRAMKDQAAVAWIRLREAGSGKVVRFVDCGGDADLDPLSATSELSEQILPRFGSRALLDLRPQWGDAEVTPSGKFVEDPAALLLGFKSNDVIYGLPFARVMKDVLPFASVAQTRTITSLRYDVTFPGHVGSIEIHAPFHPGDLLASSLPVFRIEFSARPLGPVENAPSVTARVMVTTPGSTTRRDTSVSGHLGAVGVEEHADGTIERGLFVEAGTVRASPRRLVGDSTLDFKNGVNSATFHLGLLSKRPIVRDGENVYRARIASDEATMESVISDALANRKRLDAAAAVVDGLVEEAKIPESLKELLRIAIPSFLMNTVDAETGAGQRFYSCIEGYCRYHATLDVEAHALAFYAWFAPSLIALELDRAASNISSDGVMGHDIGRDDVIGKALYPHEMPIEENTNFVLMVREYVAYTGDTAFGARHEGTIERLLQRVRACDSDGDGLAERDVANTIDDGSAAVQYSRGQTYLAVKTAAAFLAAAALRADSDPLAIEYRAYASRIRQTLQEKNWRGTHFAITADDSAVGLLDPWKSGVANSVPVEVAAGSVDGSSVLEGADSPNGLAALGSIYALRTFDEPPLSLEMLRQDLFTADERTQRRFVLGHAEHEVNGWVSLSLIRDAARAYLGADATNNVQRYALLQHRRNRLDDLDDWAGFCDSPYNRYLSYYPRGVAAIALVDGLAGLRVDRVKKRIALSPRVVPLRVPLAAFADWEALRVPWLEVEHDANGGVSGLITEPDLLGDCDVELDLRSLGGELTNTPRIR